MINLRACPAGRLVAAITGSLGGNVPRRFPGRGTSVVARRARTRCNTSVIEFGPAKRLRVVASLASELRRNMVDGLDGIGARSAQTAGMTARAILRRAFEHAIDVARLTTLRCVYASQRKTSFYVVEVAQRRLR